MQEYSGQNKQYKTFLDSFLLSCKGAITCHFSVGLGWKEFKKFLNSCFKKTCDLERGLQLGTLFFFELVILRGAPV